MKQFWKEGALTALAVLSLSFAADMVPVPAAIDIFSPFLMLFGLFVLVLPFFPAAIAGYFIRKKTAQKDYFVVPAIGAALGGILLVAISLAQVLLSSDAQLLAEVSKASGSGVTFFESMNAQELRSFFISSTAIGLVFLTIINGALGLVGGLAGGYLSGRKNKAAPKK